MSHGGEVGFPEQLWLGKIRSQWPVQAFPSEEMAARWAADNKPEERRYVIGPVPIHPEAFTAHTGRTIPAQSILEAS